MNKKKIWVILTIFVVIVGGAFYFSYRQFLSKKVAVPALDAKTEQSNTLLIFETTGGLCQYGGCFSKITIKKDGSFIEEEGGENPKSGNLGINVVKNLQTAIENSNYSLLRNNSFMGMCPTAYDGSEFVYRFQTSHGEEIIDSCKTTIDSTSPLFKEVQNILNTIYSHN